MLTYLLLCAALITGVRCIPLQSEAAASHIVIVTPQAQLHLESLPATYIHHLSPLARYASPPGAGVTHEETIVYVPAGAGVLPLNNVAAVVGRSTGAIEAEPIKQILAYDAIGNRQFGNVTQIQNLEQIQQIATQWGTQLSEAAGSIGSAFFPPQAQQLSQPEQQPQQLIAPEARHYYAIAPSVPHVLDLVRGPVFVGPVSSIRARSIQDGAAAALDEILDDAAERQQQQQQPQLLPLQQEQPAEILSRSRDGNTLKESDKPLKEAQPLELTPAQQQRDDLKAISSGGDESKLLAESQPLAAAKPEGIIASNLPQLRSIVGAGGGGGGVVGVVGSDVGIGGGDGGGILGVVGVPVQSPAVLAAAVVANELPQSKLLVDKVV